MSMRILSSLLLLLVGCIDAGGSMPVNEQASGGKLDDPTEGGYVLEREATLDTGTGNHVEVDVYARPRASDGSSFWRDLRLVVSYDDRVGYFDTDPDAPHGEWRMPPGTIGAYAFVAIQRAHHGGFPSDQSQNAWLTLARQDDGRYVGSHHVRLHGGYGDHQDNWSSVSLAFASDQLTWDSDFGRNYTVAIGISP